MKRGLGKSGTRNREENREKTIETLEQHVKRASRVTGMSWAGPKVEMVRKVNPAVACTCSSAIVRSNNGRPFPSMVPEPWSIYPFARAQQSRPRFHSLYLSAPFESQSSFKWKMMSYLPYIEPCFCWRRAIQYIKFTLRHVNYNFFECLLTTIDIKFTNSCPIVAKPAVILVNTISQLVPVLLLTLIIIVRRPQNIM